MSAYLIDEIIRITGDEKSEKFWIKAIAILGEGRVEEELGELKYQIQTGNVKNPAKYLTALLKKEIAKKAKEPKDPGEKLRTHFEENQITLFRNLMPVKPKGEADPLIMGSPYRNDTIPWATFIGPAFFTLSTNKEKSDRVLAKFRTLDGQVSVIPLIRGRISPGGKERGMLTAEHGRVLSAIEQMWVQQNCQYNKYSAGVACFCRVSVRELAELLGWKKFGGWELRRLADMVYDLKALPYYLELSSLGIKNLTGYGFSLLGKAELMDGKRHGQTETVFNVEFSTPLSYQLLHRHTVSRPKELSQTRSELAFLIRLFLEPILMSLDGKEYSKQLTDLIKELSLPAAKWHTDKSLRKHVFGKAIKELNECKTVDGRKMVVRIGDGLFDYLLFARLEMTERVEVNGRISQIISQN